MHENSDWRSQISSFILQNILPSASPEKNRNQGKYRFYLMLFNFYNHYFVWGVDGCQIFAWILIGFWAEFHSLKNLALPISNLKNCCWKKILEGIESAVWICKVTDRWSFSILLLYFQKFLWFFLSIKVWSRVAANSKEIKLWDRLIEVDAVCYI